MRGAAPDVVVLLHGLPVARNPFADLLIIERDFRGIGIRPRRFRWPARWYQGLTLMRALRDPRESVVAQLAAALDRYLRRNRRIREGAQWAVVGHSLGGCIFYRWLLDYSDRFVAEIGALPSQAVLIASPYRYAPPRRPEDQILSTAEPSTDRRATEIRLPDGRTLPFREPAADPAAIASRLPGGLVVLASPHDETALPECTLFPRELVQQHQVRQYSLAGEPAAPSTHRDICGRRESRLVLFYELNLLDKLLASRHWA